MFSYYGSKTKIVDYYPPPKYGKIIEPFAGTAKYSLKYFDREVLLVDKYDVLIKIWKWLQKASEKDVRNLPRLKEAELLSNYKFDCEEQRLLMGFLIGAAAATPRNKASFRATTHRPNHINYQINSIADNLYKIRHWEIRLGSYEEIQNQEATWFIDPPYMFGGDGYKESNKKIKFDELANWCKSRNGQAIVCENTKADWLPFTPLVDIQGSVHKTTEAIWSNYPHGFQAVQEPLF